MEEIRYGIWILEESHLWMLFMDAYFDSEQQGLS